MSAYIPPNLRAKVAPFPTADGNKMPNIQVQSQMNRKNPHIDTSSLLEFPEIGKKPNSITSTSHLTVKPKSVWGTKSPHDNFASKAKEWADKDENDRAQREEEEQKRIIDEAKRRPVYVRRNRNYDDDEYPTWNEKQHTSSLADDVYTSYHTSSYTDDSANDIHTPTTHISNPLGIRREDYEF